MTLVAESAVSRDGEIYRAEVHPGWDVRGNANGGYLMAIAARAMAAKSGRAPLTLTAHFLAPAACGPVSVTPTLLKSGRRFSTMRATLASPERPLLELLGSFADWQTLDGPTRVDASPPELPAPDACVVLDSFPGGSMQVFTSILDLRIHPDDAGFMSGVPSDRSLLRGWLRFRDEPVDAFALLVAADVFPPSIFNTHLPSAWTPTIELTAHLRSQPCEGWLRCQFSTRCIAGGLLEEDGELWDESGQLVAQTRQLALLPRAQS